MDARSVTPMWLNNVESTLWLQRVEALSQGAMPFEPWEFPGEKLLLAHDHHLAVIARWGSHSVRWVLGAELRDGDTFAYLLPAGAELGARLRDLQRYLAALDAISAVARVTAARPSRATLVHMRALQALDATLAGATHREIAGAIFGAAQVHKRWHPDSELRAQVRHLVHRGQQLMLGGYRHLLGGTETATGRFR